MFVQVCVLTFHGNTPCCRSKKLDSLFVSSLTRFFFGGNNCVCLVCFLLQVVYLFVYLLGSPISTALKLVFLGSTLKTCSTFDIRPWP